MSPHSDDDRWSSLGSKAIVLVPILCCGLPLLIALGALGGIGAVFGNPWVIGAAAVFALGVISAKMRRHRVGSPRPADDSRCPTERRAADESRSFDRLPSDQE